MESYKKQPSRASEGFLACDFLRVAENSSRFYASSGRARGARPLAHANYAALAAAILCAVEISTLNVRISMRSTSDLIRSMIFVNSGVL